MKTTKILSFLLAIVMLSVAMIVSATALTGDVNGDNDITSKDYMMLKRYALGTFDFNEDQMAAGDINGDGAVNSKDYMMLKRVVLGTYSLESDPVIKAIETALESKGTLATTFTTSYLNQEGAATVSFEKVNGKLSLVGHLDITALGAVVDVTIPMSAVASNYAFSGQATQGALEIDIQGNLVAKEYSMSTQTIDVTFKTDSDVDISSMESLLIPLCKTAMDEFLAQANDLLVNNEVGVTIADLGFTTYYEEIKPITFD